jgi:peptide subunit release factor 1 (eRF1)
VILSATDGNLAQLREVLPRSLHDNVIGQMNVDMNATPAQVWEKAFEVATAAQRQAEADLLGEVVTTARKGGSAAVGLADVLAAMQQGRIYHLLVKRDFHQPGHQCTNCGAVTVEATESCPYCGGQLRASADVANLLVQQALDAGLQVSVLDASPELEEQGGIAAVLRY